MHLSSNFKFTRSRYKSSFLVSKKFQHTDSVNESIESRNEGSEGNTTSGTVMTLSISSAIAFANEIPFDLHCSDKRYCLNPVSNLNKRFSRLRT